MQVWDEKKGKGINDSPNRFYKRKLSIPTWKKLIKDYTYYINTQEKDYFYASLLMW